MKSAECIRKDRHDFDPNCCYDICEEGGAPLPLVYDGPVKTREEIKAEIKACFEAKEQDPVNSPPHYTEGAIECIDAIRSALGPDGFRSYCQGNVLKYTWRANHKGREEDFKKATWYSRMAIGDDPRKGLKNED